MVSYSRSVSVRKMKIDALKKQGGKCLYCSDKISLRRSTADHIIPLSRGGHWKDGNIIVAACQPCNVTRGNMPWLEFIAIKNAGRKPHDET